MVAGKELAFQKKKIARAPSIMKTSVCQLIRMANVRSRDLLLCVVAYWCCCLLVVPCALQTSLDFIAFAPFLQLVLLLLLFSFVIYAHNFQL